MKKTIAIVAGGIPPNTTFPFGAPKVSIPFSTRKDMKFISLKSKV